MAFSDTKWGGFAKIIVDTSTMSVGDKVRVKSMTTGTTYDKTVATVGTPLIWETEIFKDYVKICLVETISDVETEVGGVYEEVGYGQTLFVDMIDKTSLQGIQGIINSHKESDVLNIGDEVTIRTTISGTPIDWTMQIGNIDSTNHIVDFVSKYLWSSGFVSNANYVNRTDLLNFLSDFYNGMRESEKRYIKTKTCSYSQGGTTPVTIDQKIWIPSRNEVFGDISQENNTQLAIFMTQSGRIRSVQGVGASYWQLTTRNTQYSGATDDVSNVGTLSYTTSALYALPCFRLTADS